MVTMIDGRLLQETTNVRKGGESDRKPKTKLNELWKNSHTQTRVDRGMTFWDSHRFPFPSDVCEHRLLLGRGKELRISRALGRPRSITGRQGLEGVTLDETVCLK